MVRLKRIITGTNVTLSYDCGGCDHMWQVDIPDLRKTARIAPLKPVTADDPHRTHYPRPINGILVAITVMN